MCCIGILFEISKRQLFGSAMNYQKLPFIRRFLVLLLCDELLFFKLVSYPYGSGGRQDDYTISPTLSPPYVEILASEMDIPVCAPLKKCPDTEQSILTRQMCFPPPKPGYIYHCGFDSNNQKYVDFYYLPFKCMKGTYGAPAVDGDYVKLACKDCPDGRFNPQDRYSPASMDECRSHYHIPVSLHMHVIPFLIANRTDPAVFYCDHKKSWVSSDQELFCKHSYKPCKCEYKGGTCHGDRELLPDGRCVPICAVERLPENNFDCVIQVTQKRPTVDGSVTYVAVISTNNPWIPGYNTEPRKTDEDSQEPQKTDEDSQESNRLSTGLVVAIYVGCIVTVVCVVFFVLCKNKQKCTCILLQTSKTVGRDNIKLQAEKANIYRSASHAESSSSGDSHAEDAFCSSHNAVADDNDVDEQQT